MTSVSNHPNLVNLVGACSVDGESGLKVEQSRYSSLRSSLHRYHATSVSREFRYRFEFDWFFKTMEMGGRKNRRLD